LFIVLASCTCFGVRFYPAWLVHTSLSLTSSPHGPKVRTTVPFRRQVRLDRYRKSTGTHLLTCRLYFTTFPHPPPKQETLNNPRSQLEQVDVRGICTPPCESLEPTKHYYFTIDDQLMYMSFFQDWGPLNVAMVYKACIFIHSLLIVSDSLFYDTTPNISVIYVRENETPNGLSFTPSTRPTPVSRCPRMLGDHRVPLILQLLFFGCFISCRITGPYTRYPFMMLMPYSRTKTLLPTA